MSDKKRPPWYGGNRIPDSYLAKFLTKPDPAQADMPYELRLFLDRLK